MLGTTFNIAARLEEMAKRTKENQDPNLLTIIHLTDKVRNDYIKNNSDQKKYFRKVKKNELSEKMNKRLNNDGVLSTYIYCPN